MYELIFASMFTCLERILGIQMCMHAEENADSILTIAAM